METSWRDVCICHPPLKSNNFGNMMFTTYNLEAICPHCKAPFKECKPELVISNIETEHRMMQESLNLQMESLRDELEEAEHQSKLSIYDFIFPLLFIISLIILLFN